MSHIDAETALSLYRRFCRQTEKVVEYLSVAKKLQNLLNVSIPNLKHVSRSEYLIVHFLSGLSGPCFARWRIGGVSSRPEFRTEQIGIQGK
jgi:phosphatidylinositol-binding clathrin assembly protein